MKFLHKSSIIVSRANQNLNLREKKIFNKRVKKIKTRVLSGGELASYIKLNQFNQVRRLSSQGIKPNLHIIVAIENNLPIEKYLAYKQQYGKDIGVEVAIHRVEISDLLSLITKLNSDQSVSAVILQLPIADDKLTDQALNLISPQKDVDGLGLSAAYDPATAVAILWLISGYNINLPGQNIYIVGKGRLVGGPLAKMFSESDVGHQTLGSGDDIAKLKDADIIISATGKPGLITSELVKPGAVVIDAGTASEDGLIRGDAADDLYQRSDISLTPKIGGVGPLTICALFENVIKSSQVQSASSPGANIQAENR